jgi:hypothetical protein
MIIFRDVASLVRLKSAKNHFNVKLDLLKRFNVIWGVQIARKKYSVSQLPQIKRKIATVPPLRGAFRDRHEREAGCGGRGCAFDEWRESGRRSRVVLTPRRWRLSLRAIADDGGKRARSPGRARRKPLKPLRGECRMFPV